jgi:hypothetical protein
MGRGKKKEIKKISLEIRRIRKEIKDIRAKKLLLPKGNEERIKLGRELKALKLLLKAQKEVKINKVVELNTPEPEKDKLIAEILKIEAEQNIKPTFAVLGIDLHKFTVKELEYHLKKKTKKAQGISINSSQEDSKARQLEAKKRG